jgi:hypothetical protein
MKFAITHYAEDMIDYQVCKTVKLKEDGERCMRNLFIKGTCTPKLQV